MGNKTINVKEQFTKPEKAAKQNGRRINENSLNILEPQLSQIMDLTQKIHVTYASEARTLKTQNENWFKVAGS